MKICSRCVLPETYPEIKFDVSGVCNFCNTPARSDATSHEFDQEEDWITYIQEHKKKNVRYDAVVPLSGGVDSSNALIQLVTKYKFNVLGYHHDNGYEDAAATNNVRSLCKSLNVDLHITQTDHVFLKKLWKCVNESNVPGLTACYVCGNMLYLSAIDLADRYNVPMVINGYSKGQAAMNDDKQKGVILLQKILTVAKNTGEEEFYQNVLKQYSLLDKRVPYESKKDIDCFSEDKILVLPFYLFKFYKSDKKELYNQIAQKYEWHPIACSYPSRTTNCEMVWLNSYCDLLKNRYTSYHIEYADLIRKNEITREVALRDLELNAPDGLIERLAADIGLDIERMRSIYGECEKRLSDDYDYEL